MTFNMILALIWLGSILLAAVTMPLWEDTRYGRWLDRLWARYVAAAGYVVVRVVRALRRARP